METQLEWTLPPSAQKSNAWATPASKKPVTAVRAVVRSPLYRGSTIALFLSGLGASAVAPQIALFLVRDLHASYAVAGLFS